MNFNQRLTPYEEAAEQARGWRSLALCEAAVIGFLCFCLAWDGGWRFVYRGLALLGAMVVMGIVAGLVINALKAIGKKD